MKPYSPAKLPLNDIDYNYFIEGLSEANRSLARFDGMLESIPNKYIFLTPFMTQEAVLSSKIEGTQATFQEVLEFEANTNKNREKKDDILEIKNYRMAMGHAVSKLNSVPLCTRLIKEMHEILMNDVRGSSKDPGNFRKTQNWIGKPNSTIEDASFVPPQPEKLNDIMTNFEKYLNYEDKDIIVQAAIMHAQFEIIHPFLDGNGRIGRMLIPLLFYSKKIMSEPVFYISSSFEKNRNDYYANLNTITSTGNWNDWISFFIYSINEQSNEYILKTKKIKNLYEGYKDRVSDITKSQKIIQILDTLFTVPVFRSVQFSELSGIPQKTCERNIRQLYEDGILTSDDQEKQRTYIFKDLLDLMN